MYSLEKLTVYHDGKPAVYLAPSLVKKQGLTKERIEELKKLHIQRLDLFDLMEKEKDPLMLQLCVEYLELLEYDMQEVWGFNKERNLHSWWFQSPRCLCSEKENWNAWGKERIVEPSCPLHGEKKRLRKVSLPRRIWGKIQSLIGREPTKRGYV